MWGGWGGGAHSHLPAAFLQKHIKRIQRFSFFCSRGFGDASARGGAEVSLTGVLAVPGVHDAEHVVGGRLLLAVPVLVKEAGVAAPLLQFREHFSLEKQTYSRVFSFSGVPQGSVMGPHTFLYFII